MDRISPNKNAILDSFPLTLCQLVRNYRARIFKRLADIGYNTSQKLWFYEFKVYMLVTLFDYILISKLCALFEIEQTFARVITGLQLRIEQIILVYNLRYLEFN